MASPTSNFFDLRSANVTHVDGDVPTPLRKGDPFHDYDKKGKPRMPVQMSRTAWKRLQNATLVGALWFVGAYMLSWMLRGTPPQDHHHDAHSTLRHITSGLQHHDKGSFRRVTDGVKKAYHWDESTEVRIRRHREKTMLLVFYDKADATQAKEIVEMVDQLGEDYKHTPMIHASVDKDHLAPFEFFLGDDPAEGLPYAVVVEPAHGFRKFKLEGAPTLKSLGAFEDDYYGGRLKSWLRSEVPIEEELTHNVRQLIATEFNKLVVQDVAHDSLVFFYAPWCGHCKRFEAIFAELADLHANVKSLKFFKIDATKNDVDHPEVAVERVPYVRLFTATDKQHPVVFQHTEAHLPDYGSTFLKKHAAIPFDLEAANKVAALASSDGANEF
eukprot:GDKH01008927.1.p1 GENE.GDKH01008927.1~~GDKH01008927.1.p1  ORF type:complete len:385 (+),score=75.37 GDKH01008927.1:147-1301(+)